MQRGLQEATEATRDKHSMLHLNRKKNEVIHLVHNESGDTVDLVVLEIRGKTVKLGFENDTKSHTILRKEVRQAQQQFKDPNPYYKDKKPTHTYVGRPTGMNNIPMVDMQAATDDLEQLVDTLIPTTEDNSATAAA
jgi:sRNA-binding carbon storage regulator CsrA